MGDGWHSHTQRGVDAVLKELTKTCRSWGLCAPPLSPPPPHTHSRVLPAAARTQESCAFCAVRLSFCRRITLLESTSVSPTQHKNRFSYQRWGHVAPPPRSRPPACLPRLTRHTAAGPALLLHSSNQSSGPPPPPGPRHLASRVPPSPLELSRAPPRAGLWRRTSARRR